jgi:hypothetical protein
MVAVLTLTPSLSSEIEGKVVVIEEISLHDKQSFGIFS